jgi:hypothetical protein
VGTEVIVGMHCYATVRTDTIVAAVGTKVIVGIYFVAAMGTEVIVGHTVATVETVVIVGSQ